jgi:hypothetical protein
MDGARGAGRRELHDAPVVGTGKVGVDAPPESLVEPLGAIDVGHGKHDDLELQFDGCLTHGTSRTEEKFKCKKMLSSPRP